MNALVLLLACAPPDRAALDVAEAAARMPPGFTLGGRALVPPEVPALESDTHLMEPDGDGRMQFDRPLYPAIRTSADGRVGVNIRLRDDAFDLYLVGPEGEAEPIGRSEPGVRLVKDQTTLVPTDLFDETPETAANHLTICDPTSQFPEAGEPTNPYPCAADPAQDCYDLTLVMDAQALCNDDGCDGPGEAFDTRLWATPLTVAVADPKTAGATLASVTLGTPASGPSIPVRGFFEPSISGDGHLLVARLDWTRIPVPDPDEPGETVLRAVNMVYLLADDPAADPCDVTQWTQVYPLSHLPHDPAASGYGLAHAPFRDSEGNEIADYDADGLSYPWLDRDADNLFFTSVRATLYYDADPDPEVDDVRARYPWKCLPGVDCPDPPGADALLPDHEDATITRGVGVMGLWTRNKMVVLDGPLNHLDYGLGRDADEHRILRLYAPGTGADPASNGLVHVGTGRDNGGTSPPGTTNNTAFIDSFEQRFFGTPAMVPTTTREVVWTVNTGHGSADVAFDDYLDVAAFLVVEMGASVVLTEGSSRYSLRYNDGFVPEPLTGRAGFRDAPHFQNASTVLASEWRVPRAGIGFGGVRVEPVALGGVHGKGLWLSGARDGVAFPVEAQTTHDVAATDWYTGLFVDARAPDDGAVRSLLGWPDGSLVGLEGTSALVVEDARGDEVAWVPLPDGGLAPAAWRHLGLQLTEGGTRLEVLVDGFRWEVLTLPEPLLLPVAGVLVLGDHPFDAHEGFRGWVDELKVFAAAASPEIACNHARGTLLALGPTADEAWHAVAEGRPAEAHEALAAALGQAADTRYVCFHDYTRAVEVAENVEALPADTTSVRHALLRPNGDLVSGLPRPDESETPFCASCHAWDQHPALSFDALAFDRDVTMDDDRRRQPMQPPRRIFGNVPADLFGPGRPAEAMVAPPGGLPVDPWIVP